jgi:hypothetical protein
MNRKALQITFALLLISGAGTAIACDYTAGETKYLEYAKCRYGEDNVVVVELKGSPSWNSCVYLAEAFRPEKLLAVTKDDAGTEILSLNDRSKIGNPCYITKSQCDAAYKTHKTGSY